VWGLILLVLWWLLVDGQTGGWWFAILVVGLALGIRRAMPIPLALHHMGVRAMIAFVPFFITQSLIGGVDVAWRAFHPRLPLQPALYQVPFRLQSEGAKVFLAQVISLMPGTLSCCVGPRQLTVHVLGGSREKFLSEMRDIEARTARIFGEELENAHG
jgi:multicomponent Na+:H+ antiporter subunit E